MTATALKREPGPRVETPKLSKMQEYEMLKKHIADTAKTHVEYQERIKALCDRLGV